MKPFPQFCRALRRSCITDRVDRMQRSEKRLALRNRYRLEDAQGMKQAVRSLGRVSSTGYPVSTSRLSTRSSAWDLDVTRHMGQLILGSASRLDAFSASLFLT